MKQPPADLTAREHEVLQWVAEGKTNGEIAMILAISKGTVNKHLEHILAKLQVENRTAAAAVLMRSSAGSSRLLAQSRRSVERSRRVA